MAFTRFRDDPARIEDQLKQSTGPGRWNIDVPGNGPTPQFILDPQIIPQKWGGNLWTNAVDIQSQLLGIDVTINRDCQNKTKYRKQLSHSTPITYPTTSSFLTTEQSRTIMPAWTARDLSQNHGFILPDDPQAHTTIPFQHNTSTRLVERDNFKRDISCVPVNDQQYTIPQQMGKKYQTTL
jgi:hypothetical protein